MSVILFNPRSANSKPRIPNSILSIAASIEGKFDYVILDGNMETDPAQKILDKYSNHSLYSENRKLLPMLSNQKLNAYLKEIADICEIKTRITFHIARH